MSFAATVLYINRLIDPKTVDRKIVEACVKCWFQSNPSGHKNSNDCSASSKLFRRNLV